MKRQLEPLPLTGVCKEFMSNAHQVDSNRIHYFLTPASIERLVLYITHPHVWNVENFVYYLQVAPPETSIAAVTSYQKALTSRRVNRQLIINPLETTTLAPVTSKVRYMTTEALLDWLAETDHHEAPEIRAALLWLVSSAARRAARTKITDRDARLSDLEKLLDEKDARIAELEKVVGYTEQVKDRVSERDSVISQLQTDLANVLFDLNRAKRRAAQLEESDDDECATPRKRLRVLAD
jgi:hypothetical protein